jgi:hypothetical protein
MRRIELRIGLLRVILEFLPRVILARRFPSAMKLQRHLERRIRRELRVRRNTMVAFD